MNIHTVPEKIKYKDLLCSVSIFILILKQPHQSKFRSKSQDATNTENFPGGYIFLFKAIYIFISPNFDKSSLILSEESIWRGYFPDITFFGATRCTRLS